MAGLLEDNGRASGYENIFQQKNHGPRNITEDIQPTVQISFHSFQLISVMRRSDQFPSIPVHQKRDQNALAPRDSQSQTVDRDFHESLINRK